MTRPLARGARPSESSPRVQMLALLHLAPLCLVSALAGSCATPEDPAPASLQLWFAPLAASCTNDTNGSGTVPEAVETLAVVLESEGTPPITERKSRSSVNKAGFWEIAGLIVTPKLDVRAYGCDKDGKVIYAGRSNGASIADQTETTVRTFLAPVAGLACTGGADAKAADGQGALYSPRSFVRVASLTDGNAVVTGGLGAWNGQDKKGFAALDTEVYEHQGGFFRKGPAMLDKRVFHHAFGLDARRALVVGGVSNVLQLSIGLLGGRLLAPESVGNSLPKAAAELVDIGEPGTGAGATAAAVAVDVGAGAHFLSSAVRTGDSLLFAGGIDAAGKATRKATRVSGLADIAGGGTGTSEHFDLLTDRVGPALLAFGDGTTVIWGGHTSGLVGDLGELLKKSDKTTTKIAVSGAKAILDNTHLAASGAAAAVIASTAEKLTFVVTGGQPFDTPLSAADAPSYLVEVGLDGKAVVYALSLSAGNLRGGVGTAVTRLPAGQALFAGGLLAPSGGDPCLPTDQECLISDVFLLELAEAPSGDTAKLTSLMSQGTLGAPRVGVTAAPLPVGALLVGGQSTVVDAAVKGGQGLDPTGRVIMGRPDAAAGKAICGM